MVTLLDSASRGGGGGRSSAAAATAHAAAAAAESAALRRRHVGVRTAGGDSSSSSAWGQEAPWQHQQQQQQQHYLQRQASQLSQQQHQHQQQQLWRAFCAEHYSASSMTHDGVFFFVHFIMTAVHKRLLVSQREHVVFNSAMLLFAGALVMRTWSKHLYSRLRPLLVLVLHMALTVLRACAVNSMSSKQAVHFKASFVAGTIDTAGSLFLTILSVLGGPFRLFEMLGLQQPWRHHAAITALYVAVHPLAAAHGVRLAFSNAMYFQVHEVHDTLSAVVDSLLGAVIGLPPLQQQTCSSCAGVVIYMTMCLFASVVAPLYVVYHIEQAAWSTWLEQRTAAAAAAAAAAPSSSASSSSSSSSGGSSGDALLAGRHPAAAELAALGTQQGAADEGRGGAADAAVSRRQRQRNQAVQQHLLALCQAPGSGGSSSRLPRQNAAPLPLDSLLPGSAALAGPQAIDHFLLRGLVHMLVLACLLVACWVASNAVALLLLSRVLSARQLAFWCPNRPYPPFQIAGQVYDGI